MAAGSNWVGNAKYHFWGNFWEILKHENFATVIFMILNFMKA